MRKLEGVYTEEDQKDICLCEIGTTKCPLGKEACVSYSFKGNDMQDGGFNCAHFDRFTEIGGYPPILDKKYTKIQGITVKCQLVNSVEFIKKD